MLVEASRRNVQRGSNVSHINASGLVDCSEARDPMHVGWRFDTVRTTVTNSIFICYRSADEPFAAILIETRLIDRFGSGQVFRDNRTIPLGVHFPDHLSHALQACQALIAVIGRGWRGKSRNGQRRIDDPRDYVRNEIAAALWRGILVVPVLVGEVPLPTAEMLPAEIAGLASRQYLRLRARTAHHDAARLANELGTLLGEADPPAKRRSTGNRAGPAAAVHELHGPVDARQSVFGNAYAGGPHRVFMCAQP
jgi:hypothetical protein